MNWTQSSRWLADLGLIGAWPLPSGLTGFFVFVSLLKSVEFWYYTIWVFFKGEGCALDLGQSIQDIKDGKCSDRDFDQTLDRYPIFRPDRWLISQYIWFLPKPLRIIGVRVFYYPFLCVAGASLIFAESSSRTDLLLCSLALLSLVWSHLIHVINSRLQMGFADHYFRRLSVPMASPTGRFVVEPRFFVIRYFSKLFIGMVTTATVAYGAVYWATQKLSNGQAFHGEINRGSDCVYFSIVTLATVGFGDIYPLTTVARLFVSSEIVLGMLLVVLLVTSFNGSVDPERLAILREKRYE